MKHFKMIALFICFATGFNGFANCQIYSNEALFYVEAGKSLLNNPSIEIIYVDNDADIVFVTSTRMSNIEKNGFPKYDNADHIRESSSTIYQCKYNSRLSKNGKEIYEYYSYGSVTFYFVFSEDKSTMEQIRWDGKTKITYVRVTRDKFKTKGSSENNDFLYD